MPDIVLESGTAASHFAEFTIAYTSTQRRLIPGVAGFYEVLSGSRTVLSCSHDNSLTGLDYAPITVANYLPLQPAYIGGYTTLVIPNYGQAIDKFDWLSPFTYVWTATVVTAVGCHLATNTPPTIGAWPIVYKSDNTRFCGPPSPYPFGQAGMSTFFRFWPCPVPATYPSQVSSHEHFITIGRTVCGAGYTNSLSLESTINAEAHSYPTAEFLIRDTGADPSYAFVDHFGYPNPVLTSQGKTLTVGYAFPAPWTIYGGGGSIFTVDDPGNDAPFTVNHTVTYRIDVTNWKLQVLLRFINNTIPSTTPPYISTARYKDTVAQAWFGAVSGTTKPLYIGVHRGIQGNLGSGSGSTAGWETYTYSSSIDYRSDVGLTFLPNGDLVLRYDTYAANGTKTSKYTVNHKQGAGSAADWSAAANVTPNVGQQLGTDKAQGMAITIRQGA